MDESGEKRTLSAMKPGEEEEEHQFDARTPSPSATKRLKTAVGAVLSGSISALTSLASSSAGGSRSVPRASFTTGSTGTSSTASTPVPTDLNGAVSSSPVDYAAPAAAASAAPAPAPRKSSREKTSTLIYVDGYAVRHCSSWLLLRKHKVLFLSLLLFVCAIFCSYVHKTHHIRIFVRC
jgi:hypothetical protein